MSQEPSWPAVAYERHDWVPMVDVPRRRQATYSGPYEAAVPPRIAGQTITLPSDLAAEASEATAALAAFDSEMGHDVAPFAVILLRSESASSSRIEQLTASAKAIALAELGSADRRNASVIAANTTAMRAAIDLADQLDGEAIISTQAALLGESHPEATGEWRTQQVWIGASNYGPHDAQFVPPHHSRIADAIDDLISFMHRDDMPVLVQAALAHAQFETTHPFIDGNGRTGRALVHSLLRNKSVTTNVTVPVSAGLLTNLDGYFDALTRFRAGDPYPIIDRFSDATFSAVQTGRTLVEELRTIRATWATSITARADAAVWRLVDLALRQPVLNSRLVQTELEVSKPTADAAIERLVTTGVLHQFTDGRRNRKYEAPDVLAALDAFAERSARRHRAEHDG